MRDIAEEAKRDAAEPLSVCIGTDSEEVGDGVKFVTAVVLRRERRGARFYAYSDTDFTMVLRDRKGTERFRERIYREVMLTATLAAEVRGVLTETFNGLLPAGLEVHADVGESGSSAKMLSQVIGILKGYGFAEQEIFVKPNAYAASTVADRAI
jgi:predicted RNase H-related nuclease YkuK (DUF458 family)